MYQVGRWGRCGRRRRPVSTTGSLWFACSSSRSPSRSAWDPSPGYLSASCTHWSTAVWAGPWPRRSAMRAPSSASRRSSISKRRSDSTALFGSTPSFHCSDSSSSCSSCRRHVAEDSMKWNRNHLLLLLLPPLPLPPPPPRPLPIKTRRELWTLPSSAYQ